MEQLGKVGILTAVLLVACAASAADDLIPPDSIDVNVERGFFGSCGSAGRELQLVLKGNSGRVISRFERVISDDVFRPYVWGTGPIAQGSYMIVARVIGPSGAEWSSDRVQLKVESGLLGSPWVKVTVGLDAAAQVVTHGLCVCTARGGRGVLELSGERPPRLLNVSGRSLAPCGWKSGNIWDVQHLLEGSWGAHGRSVAFGLPIDVSEIKDGEEVRLVHTGVWRMGRNSNRQALEEAPRRLKVRLSVDPESVSLREVKFPEIAQGWCCDVYYVDWPHDPEKGTSSIAK